MLGIVVQGWGSISELEDSVKGMQVVEYCGMGMGMASGESVSDDKWLDKLGRDIIQHWVHA